MTTRSLPLYSQVRAQGVEIVRAKWGFSRWYGEWQMRSIQAMFFPTRGGR